VERNDALPHRDARTSAFRGQMLSDVPDDQLDELAREAAASVGAPIGAVSLVLERIQLFRAQVGMPADLAAVRATDRDVSFCQLAVRGRAPLQVNDATTDPRVPTDLVHRYGVRAYLGVPLEVGGQPVGALCVIDLAPREFDGAQVEALTRIAARVEARLEELARAHHQRTHPRTVFGPVFAELRNRLMPLDTNLVSAQVAAAEARALARLLEQVGEHGVVPALGGLQHAVLALDDLDAALADAHAATAEIERGLAALQTALIASAPSARIEVVIDAALTLAHHETKLIGGVRPPPALAPDLRLAAVAESTRALAWAVSAVAVQVRTRRGNRGVDLAVRDAGARVAVDVTAPDLATEPAAPLPIAAGEFDAEARPGGITAYLARAR
jgi:hypothetical protein